MALAWALCVLALVCALCILIALLFFSIISTLVREAAPFIPTPARHALAIGEALGIETSDVVYELGSGDGRIVLALARAYPQAQFVGIERDPLVHAGAMLRRLVAGSPSNTRLVWGDIFKTPLEEADKVYLYLLPSYMETLLPLLEQAAVSRAVSRAFPFKHKDARAIVHIGNKAALFAHGEHQLFVYDFEHTATE